MMGWKEDKITIDVLRIGKKYNAAIEFNPKEQSLYRWCCRICSADDVDCVSGGGHYYKSYAECVAFRDGLVGHVKNILKIELEDAEDFE